MLDTVDFISYLRTLDIRLVVDADGRLSCTAPKGVVTPELKTELKARKPAILDFLQGCGLSEPAPPVERIARTGRMEPSSRQQQMWFLQRFDSESAAYNIARRVAVRREAKPGQPGEEPQGDHPQARSPADQHRRSGRRAHSRDSRSRGLEDGSSLAA